MTEVAKDADGAAGAETVAPAQAEAHSTRRAFVRRALMSMFVALPVVKALAFPASAAAYRDCVDQPCQWVNVGGHCCCWCGGFWCGPKRACIDPITGSYCKCACSYCVCYTMPACL
jgi:hypothetical protein